VQGRSTESLDVNMPGLAVTLNGSKVAVVSSEGLNILSVRVHGDVVGPEFATLDVSGGLYGEGPNSTNFIWVADRPVAPGDEITVTLLENASTSHRGKTIDELYPEDEQPMGPWPSMELAFEQISNMPKVRSGFRFEVVPPSGDAIRSRTAANDHLFGFSILWNWKRPDRARVSLSSNNLEQIEKRAGGIDHAEFHLEYGQSVSFRVDV